MTRPAVLLATGSLLLLHLAAPGPSQAVLLQSAPGGAASVEAANQVLLQIDSAQTSYAGVRGSTSDASSAPVDISISFP